MAAADHAPDSLATLLAPLTAAAFAARHYLREPLVLQGRTDRFGSLFSWPELNDVLEGLAFHGARDSIEVARGATKVIPRSLDDLHRLCQDGHTVVIKQLERHHGRVRRLALGLQKEMGERIGGNLYLSQAGVPGFPRHYDDHDVFVLQLEGSKHWRLWGVTQPLPTYSLRRAQPPAPPPDPREPPRELVLQRGDLLYLPRGWWHEALARDEASLHLTVAIYPRTGMEFVTWLLDLLEEQVAFRQARPLLARTPTPPPEFRAWLAEIAEVMAHVSRSEEVADLYYRRCLEEVEPPSPPRFPLTRSSAATPARDDR